MLQKASVFRTAVTVVLSAMMALPTPSLAKMNNDDVDPVTTEGAPVILHSVVIDGQPATLVLAPVAQEDEVELATKLAKNNPENLILEVAGPEDPVLKAVAKTGYLKKIKTYFVGKFEQSPLFQSDLLKPAIKEKLRSQVDRFNAVYQEKKSGFMWALIYSGVNATSVGLTSSSVPAGMAVLGKLFFWNALMIAKPEVWGRILEASGNKALQLGERTAALIGSEFSDADKRLCEMGGKFAVSWAVNTVQAAMIRGWSGQWTGSAADFATVAWFGVLNNYNIWDAVVLRKYNQKKISDKWVQNYFKTQFLLGSFLEVLAYRDVPYVSLALATTTLSGLLFLLLSEERREKIFTKAESLNLSFRAGYAQIASPQNHLALINRKIGSIRSRSAKAKANEKSKCESALLPNTRLSTAASDFTAFPMGKLAYE